MSKRKAPYSAKEKLLHKAKTALSREIKKAKSLLIQEVVKDLKKAKKEANDAESTKTKQLEDKLAALKAIDVHDAAAKVISDAGLSVSQDDDESDNEDVRAEDDGFDSEEFDGEIDLIEKPDTVDTEDSQQNKASIANKMMDKLLAHRSLSETLAAIKQVAELQEREDVKKQRQKEKRAVNRGNKRDALVGGRSSNAPSSVFFGSLSSNGQATAAQDEDDIADFLGENGKKKKKNRPGQMARRQKAMRREEAARDPSKRFADHSLSKYGPSERPKKRKPEEHRGRESSRPKERKVQEKREVREVKEVKKTPEELHPSWAAKQALKAKENAGIHDFKGSKITFDD